MSTGAPFGTSESHSGKPPVVLTIAGFDPSSGAGITADLQVFAAHGLFGTACITALTVQSTQGVAAVEPVSALMTPTLSHLNADLPPVGIKIGMLGTAEAVAAVSAYLSRRRGPKIPIVLDPIVRSSSGASLLTPKGLSVLQTELLPLVDWITPNRNELGELSGVPTCSDGDVEEALWALNRLHPHLNIVSTGGDHTGEGTVDTLLVPPGEIYRFEGERIATTSTHGTGCAFSSALLARLVLGYAPQDAVGAAKRYVSEALKHAPGLGHGHGPLNLLWPLKPR